MTTYSLKNSSDNILRIIIEPEAIEFDLKPKEEVAVIASGNNPVFQCESFVNGEGINCMAFWPDKGRVEIKYKGKNIFDI